MMKMIRPILWNILNKKHIEDSEFNTYGPETIIKLVKETKCGLRFPSFHTGDINTSVISYAYPERFINRNTHLAFKTLFDIENAKEHEPQFTKDETAFIICGGGNYLPSLYMAVKSLREIGKWDGAIEVWYRGNDDLTFQQHIDDDRVYFRNIYDYVDSSLRVPLHPFLLKYVAAKHSEYRKIFYVDGDVYFVGDVNQIVKDIDTRGCVMFPDSRFTENVNWKMLSDYWGNDWFCAPSSICGGYWYLDKAKFQKQLNLMLWMNLHPEYFYTSLFPCSDQDILRFCFYITKARYSQFDSYPDIHYLDSFTALDSMGDPFAYHRWGNKFLMTNPDCLNHKFQADEEVNNKLMDYYREFMHLNKLPPLEEDCLASCVMLTQESRKGFVTEAIAQFYSQTYINKELVILYQGSDSYKDYLQSLCPTAIIKKNTHSHLGDARQETVALANGSVIVQWDDDDVSFPDRIATQVGYLNTHEACICNRMEFECEDKRYVAYNKEGWNMTLAARKENFPNYEKISLGEDKGIWDIFRLRGQSVCIDDKIYRYRHHGRNTSDKTFVNYILNHSIRID